MKNKIITIILMVIALFLGSIFMKSISSASISISSADLYSKGYYNNLLRYQGIHIETDFVVYKDGGIEYPAYCLQHNLHGVSGNDDYSVSVNKLVTDVMVWRVIINGYPYKTYQELGCNNKEEAFMATKQAVYCILYDRDLGDYASMGNAAGDRCLKALKTIVTNAKKSSEIKISSDFTIKAVKTKWEIDSIDTKYVSITYSVTAAGGMSKYKVSVSGNLPEGGYIADEKNNKKTTFNSGDKFKILIPIINLKEDGNFTINIEGEVETKPVLYGKSADSSRQDYALTAGVYEDGTGSLKSYYTKNSTQITILKQEANTEKPLEGVYFEVLDKNKNVIHTELVTNANGEIVITDLVPGKYFIKETKTLEGYTLYDKLIEIDLDLNEASKIIVNNSEEEVEVEKKTTDTTSEVGVKEITKTVTVKLPKTGM